MDDSSDSENERLNADQYKTAQGQWLIKHYPPMKQVMALIAERDAAIQERNLAISEGKATSAERDMAFLQRDTAIAERNNAILERDSALAARQYRENSTTNANPSSSSPSGCQMSRKVEHVHHPQQQMHHHHHMTQMGGNAYGTIELEPSDTVFPSSPHTSDAENPERGKRRNEAAKSTTPSNNKVQKNQMKVKSENEDLNKITSGSDEEPNGTQTICLESDWEGHEMGLNQVVYDESTMPHPLCSCTGVLRQCHKWGNGGWQSSCCTTKLSMYPLPALPNKRHARIGGRKMSASAFNKLLNRLAAEGHDLSNPVDLKNHWAKHGTNRYITIK